MDDDAVNPSISAGWKSYGILGERPIRPFEQVTMSDKPNSVSTLTVSTPAATRTILIVEDDPSVTETFERMLRLE
jgi:hypothetical protein